MVKETTSKTKDYRAELQIPSQRRAVEKPRVRVAVSPSRGAAVPVRQPALCRKSPDAKCFCCRAAEGETRETWGKAGAWDTNIWGCEDLSSIWRRERPKFTAGLRGGERRGQGRSAGISFQSPCVSGSGIRNIRVIKVIKLEVKASSVAWISISGTRLCVGCTRAASCHGGVAHGGQQRQWPFLQQLWWERRMSHKDFSPQEGAVRESPLGQARGLLHFRGSPLSQPQMAGS